MKELLSQRKNSASDSTRVFFPAPEGPANKTDPSGHFLNQIVLHNFEQILAKTCFASC